MQPKIELNLRPLSFTIYVKRFFICDYELGKSTHIYLDSTIIMGEKWYGEDNY